MFNHGALSRAEARAWHSGGRRPTQRGGQDVLPLRVAEPNLAGVLGIYRRFEWFFVDTLKSDLWYVMVRDIDQRSECILHFYYKVKLDLGIEQLLIRGPFWRKDPQ